MMESSLDLHELEKLSAGTESDSKTDKRKKKDTEKWQMILEPVLVGSMMAINLGATSLQNFYLRTACTVDLQLNSTICDKGVGEDFREAEALSQTIVSSVNISRSFVGSFIATFVLLFLGPWSDCSGRRKPSLILPLVGMSVMTTGVLLMLIFPGANTVQTLYVVQIPISLGGNFGLLLAAAFSHIGDICHATGRDVTRTMGTHRAAVQVAQMVGIIGGPLLYRYLGFYGVFPLVLLLQLSSLVYVIFYITDVNINADNKVSVFDPRLPFNAVWCLIKKRDGYKRFILLLLLVVTLGDKMLISAEIQLAYMFYRLKFHWDDVMFGSFAAYRYSVGFLGTVIILSVLKRRWQLSNEIVGVLSCMSYIFATSTLMAVTSTILVFFTPIIGIIAQGSQVVQRPLVNKQILPTEQGKIYSVLGALESAIGTISYPLYNLLYTKTVTTFPEAWLIPGLVVSSLQLLSYFLTRFLAQKTDTDVDKEKEAPTAQPLIDQEAIRQPKENIDPQSKNKLSQDAIDKSVDSER